MSVPIPFLVAVAGIFGIRECMSLLLLRGGTVFGPEPLGERDILIGGGKILAVAPWLPVPAAFGHAPCQEISVHGAFIVPGFIDPHVHLAGGGGESGPASRVPRLSLTDLTRAGITTCVGVLGTDGTTRSMAELLAVTRAFRAEGLSAFCWTGSYELPPVTLTGSVRKDLVFIDPIIGFGELAISDHRSSQPTFDEFIRIAADCHVGGLMSGKAGVLHLHLGDGKRGLSLVSRALDETELPPRVFYPTHVNRRKSLFDESISIAKAGCTVDVTAFPVEDGEDAYSAADAIERFWAQGAPLSQITCSSDGGGCLPTYDRQGNLLALDVGRALSVPETLRELLLRGHALDEALLPFTANAASLLKLPTKGRIAVGMDADLVVLTQNYDVRDVYALGAPMVRDGIPVRGGSFEGSLASG